MPNRLHRTTTPGTFTIKWSTSRLFPRQREQHDILDFSYCPLSRVLHVTLANWQEFEFEFHLRSSPSYSEYMDISQPAEYFI